MQFLVSHKCTSKTMSHIWAAWALFQCMNHKIIRAIIIILHQVDYYKLVKTERQKIPIAPCPVMNCMSYWSNYLQSHGQLQHDTELIMFPSAQAEPQLLQNSFCWNNKEKWFFTYLALCICQCMQVGINPTSPWWWPSVSVWLKRREPDCSRYQWRIA